jgi:hypothetical protein
VVRHVATHLEELSDSDLDSHMDYKVSCEGGFICIKADHFGGIAVCVLERLDQKGNSQCASVIDLWNNCKYKYSSKSIS